MCAVGLHMAFVGKLIKLFPIEAVLFAHIFGSKPHRNQAVAGALIFEELVRQFVRSDHAVHVEHRHRLDSSADSTF